MPLQDVQLLCFGAAAVIDTALLFVLFERRNWRRVLLPVVMLIVGAWLYHTGTFVHTLLRDTPGDTASLLHALTMTVIAAGLLLMPSAMLHTMLRLKDTGIIAPIRPRWRYLSSYWPMLGLPIASVLIAKNPRGEFLTLVAPLVTPYIVWLMVVNMVCAVGFYRMRDKSTIRGGRSFLTILPVLLVLLAVIHSVVILLILPAAPEQKEFWSLLIVLSPLALVLLFAYYILRYSFMQLALERTIVYGIIVLGVVVAHRFVFRNFHESWDQRFRFDFAYIETALLVVLVLAYRPLRQRTAEALRYFMGERFVQARDRVRQTALDMSALAGRSPGEIIRWFEATLKDIFEVQYVNVSLLDSEDDGSNLRDDDGQLTNPSARKLWDAMISSAVISCTPHNAPAGELDNVLGDWEISLVVALNQPGVTGVIVLGPRSNNRLFGAEQINMVVMLVEQLGITLTTSRLQAERIAAERRAVQHEKLSAIGLVTGSIAHEVKNPLSSIKTIAAVLAEDLADGPHARDLQLILGEVDRLSETVSQLLNFARPSQNDNSTASLSGAVKGTLQLMRHVATERGVTLMDSIPNDSDHVCGNENGLREIVFNLISNAIDAAGPRGNVEIAVNQEDGFVVLIVRDDGAGISPEVQDSLFEPFVTGKENGTGLGLYVVARHIRELGGEIHCETEKGHGTQFVVRLPCDDTVA